MKRHNFLTIEFIERAKDVHGDKFGYTHVKVKSYGKEVSIDCQRHGSFMQTPTEHLRGRGCPYCAYKRLTKEEFIESAIKMHGDVFDLSNCNYSHKKKSTDRITISCKTHGDFETSVTGFLQGTGCPKCGWEAKLKARLNKKKIVVSPVEKEELNNAKHITYSVTMKFQPANSNVNGVTSIKSYINKEEAEKYLGILCTAIELTDSKITEAIITEEKESLVDYKIVAVLIKSLHLKTYEDFLKWWDKTRPCPIPRNLHECYPNFKEFFNGNEFGLKSALMKTIILSDYNNRKSA